MILMVKKPDYLGNSMWEFKHGANAIHAHIEDARWLSNFRSGREILQPGSALSCDVKYKFTYDENGELLDTKYDITKVQQVMPPPVNENGQLF